MFHMGWFLGDGFGIHPWSEKNGDGPWTGDNVNDWMKPDIYIDLAQGLERAGFDFILFEDTSMLEDSYGGDAEVTLRRGFFAPKNDPMPLVPLMTRATKHIGVISTVSVIQYHPYLAARLYTTLDHLTEGRVGMNVVTSVTDRVAQNFGLERHIEHDERYRMAMEWTDVVKQLQDSWEPGAVIADPVAGVYADHTKVHTVDHKGEYYASRGPLNTIPGPQRIVPVCTAGSSEPGRQLSARHGDTMISMGGSIEGAKAYREDMRARVAAEGRNPDDVKFLFLVAPILGTTDAEAQATFEAMQAQANTPESIEYRLWHSSYVSGGRIDFSKFDLDMKVADIDTSMQNGEKTSSLGQFANMGDTTLRELMTSTAGLGKFGLVGTPDTVAARMGEAMEEIGGDGFLLYMPMTRMNITMVSDGLGPALRRRGLIRDEYTGSTLRDHLLQF